MRSNLKCLKKQLDDKDRASKAAVSANVIEEVKALLAANPEARVIVQQLRAYSNTKVKCFVVYSTLLNVQESSFLD
jgi:alanyl-tRNA synthetase